MEEIHQAITQNIKTGRYFQDAREWYFAKYLFPYTVRSVFFVSCLGLMLASAVAFSNLLMLYPVTREMPLVIVSKDTLNYRSTIKTLGNSNESATVSVAKYLLERYVGIFESYDYNAIKHQDEFIRNNSTKYIYRNFRNYMSIDNPNSPIMLYRDNARKHIVVDSVTLGHSYKESKEEVLPDQAKIMFTVKIDRKGEPDIVKQYQATVKFIMTEISEKQENRNFSFLVTSYEVQEIGRRS